MFASSVKMRMPSSSLSPCAASMTSFEKRDSWLSSVSTTGRRIGSPPAATSAALRASI